MSLSCDVSFTLLTFEKSTLSWPDSSDATTLGILKLRIHIKPGWHSSMTQQIDELSANGLNKTHHRVAFAKPLMSKNCARIWVHHETIFWPKKHIKSLIPPSGTSHSWISQSYRNFMKLHLFYFFSNLFLHWNRPSSLGKKIIHTHLNPSHPPTKKQLPNSPPLTIHASNVCTRQKGTPMWVGAFGVAATLGSGWTKPPLTEEIPRPVEILLMAEILHQLIGSFSHYL